MFCRRVDFRERLAEGEHSVPSPRPSSTYFPWINRGPADSGPLNTSGTEGPNIYLGCSVAGLRRAGRRARIFNGDKLSAARFRSASRVSAEAGLPGQSPGAATEHQAIRIHHHKLFRCFIY
ncbi:hypothetical protein AAFF_G00352630 [Aldrovandia affinis]|uniref:Uncharacterized protein n=1 Tax=Aldrovandia affinis TaxID=143900 RepID=A0AAD7SL76_9TELE|nr:hypothetical protein AAFF_G00352630 [Aldrovandia affinis]